MFLYKYNHCVCTTPPWDEQLREAYIGYLDVENYHLDNEPYEWIIGIDVLDKITENKK